MLKQLLEAEKAHFFALSEEEVPMKKIVHRIGRGEATIRRFAATSARGLPPSVTSV